MVCRCRSTECVVFQELLAEVKSLKNTVKKQEKDIRALEEKVKQLESALELKDGRRSDDEEES